MPKAVMLHLVRATQDSLHGALFDAFGRAPLDEKAGLLEEPPDVEIKRKADAELLAKLRAARRALESLS